MIQEFTTYIAANTSFTLGTDLFTEWKLILNPEPQSYVVVQNTGSGGVNFHAPFLSESNVKVISFAKNNYIGAKGNANTIYKLVKQLNQVIYCP